jgi:PKD repeat protein
MKKIPVQKNREPIRKGVFFSSILLILLLACGCGSSVAADDYVRIQADPISGDPPLTVSFSADVQSSAGEPARYVWSLGDGERRGEKAFSYTYTEEGTYRVNMVVQFEDGSFGYADIVRITVGNPTAAPVSTMTTRAPTTAPTQAPTGAPTTAPTGAQTTAPTPAPQPQQQSDTASSPFSSTPVISANNDPIYPVRVSIAPVQGVKSHIVSFAVKEAGTKINRPKAYSWDFGDASRGGGSEPRHIYSEAGTYTPVLKVNFADGHEEILELAPIIVYDAMPTGAIPPYVINQPQVQTPSTSQSEENRPLTPGADLYVVKIVPNKNSGKAPLLVRFGHEAEGGVPLVFKWDFGDGQQTTIAKPSHSYNVPGTYVVQLSVQFYGVVWIDAEPLTITVG